jgi:hypothetical protein
VGTAVGVSTGPGIVAVGIGVGEGASDVAGRGVAVGAALPPQAASNSAAIAAMIAILSNSAPNRCCVRTSFLPSSSVIDEPEKRARVR